MGVLPGMPGLSADELVAPAVFLRRETKSSVCLRT